MLRIISVVIYLCFYFKLGCHLTTIIYCPDPAQQALMKISQGGDGLFTTILLAASFWTLLANILVEPVENLLNMLKKTSPAHFQSSEEYEGINAS